jgi:integrase
LTRLSNLGASVYVVQAVARHSHLQTTQAYIHTQGEGRTLEAARLLDEAAMATVRGKRVAKRAKGGKK